MQIKKYQAKNLKEGKLKIYNELGDDAIILSTRTIKPSDSNDDEYFEIVAAIEDQPMRNNFIKYKEMVDQLVQNGHKKQDNNDNESLMLLAKINEDINELKSISRDISDSIKYKYLNGLTPELTIIYKKLIKADISEEISLSIISQLSTDGLADNLQKAQKRAKQLLTENIQILTPFKNNKKQTIALFFGPTGNGKTLTLIKLANIAKLVFQSNVYLISADTDKVGGSDQLETYATISGIPFDTAYTPKELRELIVKAKDKEFIFIDTTGRSQNNSEHLNELSIIIDLLSPDYSYLVHSCTTNTATLIQSFQKYKKLNPSGLILTKFDEAASIGPVITALKEYKIPLAYFTNGQNIPDDIEPASKEFIGKIVIPDNKY